MKPVLRVYPDRESLDRAAAAQVTDLLISARAARRAPVALALSGGVTPQGLYSLLAAPEFSARVPWADVRVFWTDERCVPPDHADSNYGMARRLLLSKVPVAPANVFRIRGELAPSLAAREYETLLRDFGRGCDVTLLGVGEDGHTASLFPGDAALEEKTAWATIGTSPRGPRVTMTLPFLNLSDNVLVLASGTGKAKVVAAAVGSSGEAYPVQRLRASKPTVWLVDRDAAGPNQV